MDQTVALLERLIALTNADASEEARWAAVRALQDRDASEVMRLIAPLANDPDARLRALVPDVLRSSAGEARSHVEGSIDVLRAMLRVEQPSAVLVALATAFVDLRHPAALELLGPLVDHADEDVRDAVVHGLMPIADRAVSELIRLSRDRSARVRNWATFGLSQQLGDLDPIDTPEIREALAARLQDEHACAEAAFGLAVRGDRRALPIVRRALESGPEACGNEWDWSLWLASAARLADLQLVPALLRLATTGDADVDAALAACRRG